MENGYLHQNGIDENSINGEAVAVAAEENIDARPQPNVQFLDNPNIHPATGNPGIPNNPIPQGEHIPQPQGNNQFGTVRDRLFHAMLVRFAISYNHHVSGFSRRLLEFSVLFFALSLLCLLFYVHFVFSKADNSCLKHLVDSWPRDGVMRIEVISNLEKFNEYQERISEKQRSQKESNASFTFFDLKKILMEGPNALPKELKAKHGETSKKTDHWTNFRLPEETLISLFLKSSKGVKRKLSVEEVHGDEEELLDFIEEDGFYGESLEALFEYVVEYSLHYGLLRLSHSYRVEHNIPFMLVRLDPETDSCFGDWFSRMLMKFFMGYEDVLMASVKALAENETEKGYLRDMITGEHYRFVTMASGNSSYLTATFVLLIFTFAISMLLRFSHHQIFLFIFDLLQMFEMNQALVFPAAPLLTVILALVG
ncbi:unnamed protein product [Dracunculus medinensis]|uniref:Membralin n=1 Tax=Dracunculus medinensis TaxID=318479 RepID=A0A158Q5K5_DRAME|nr:unnamed protein product [Dracunculus medinensis]